MKGDWADSLAAEHEAVLALFDKALETDETQTLKRRMLLMQIGHALDKHAYAEEHVVYPALRESNDVADAETLETGHGEVKEFLYRLSHIKPEAPEWIETIRQFRGAVAAHARMEEETIFPQLRREIGEALDERLTKEVNRAGMMMA